MNPTKIPWADVVWNPVTGCSPASEGCANCYAKRVAETRLRGRCGYDAADPFKVTLHDEKLDEPLRARKPKRIFVCSMGDLFHDDVPTDFIADVFDTMASATAACGKNHRHEEECWTGDSHTFILLTKRPERARMLIEEEIPHLVANYWPGDTTLSIAMEFGWPLPNVWLGVSVENQKRADERIPILLQTPAAKRFVSAEPLLEPVDLGLDAATCDCCKRWGNRWVLVPRTVSPDLWVKAITPDFGVVGPGVHRGGMNRHGALSIKDSRGADLGIRPGEAEALPALDLVIAGPETGPGARPCDPAWIADLYGQCRLAGVPFFDKRDDYLAREWPK